MLPSFLQYANPNYNPNHTPNVNTIQLMTSLLDGNISGVAKSDNWVGSVFIYSCSQTLKTIDFKRN
jgi:hypothetical protein